MWSDRLSQNLSLTTGVLLLMMVKNRDSLRMRVLLSIWNVQRNEKINDYYIDVLEKKVNLQSKRIKAYNIYHYLFLQIK